MYYITIVFDAQYFYPALFYIDIQIFTWQNYSL